MGRGGTWLWGHVPGRETSAVEAAPGPLPSFPPAQEVDPCKTCRESPSLSGTCLCPVDPALVSGLGQRPRALLLLAAARGGNWGGSGQVVGTSGAGALAPGGVCSASLQTRSPSQWLPATLSAPSANPLLCSVREDPAVPLLPIVPKLRTYCLDFIPK